MKTGKITVTALLLSVSFILSILEGLVPISAFLPIPGLKMGLANIAVMAAFFYCGKKEAFYIAVLRPLLSFLLFGNITSFILSLSGGILSYLSLLCTHKLYNKVFSFGGISILCAVFHASGQIIAASFVLYDGAIFSYLPLLCAASSVTGLLNGFIMNLLFKIKAFGGLK